jgi:hypothetical protein
MNLEVTWLAGAQTDMLEWYARFGDRLYFRVEAAIKQLVSFPESGGSYRGRFRRLVLTGTPLGLFYCIEPRRLVLTALLDLRCDPAAIRRRLRGP